MELNTNALSKEREQDILNRLKIEHAGSFIDNRSFFERILQKNKYKKLMTSKTLLEFMKERAELHEKGICYGSLEEVLTEPFIGMTKEELYFIGLDREKCDRWLSSHIKTMMGEVAIMGKNRYETIHRYRDKIKK